MNMKMNKKYILLVFLLFLYFFWKNNQQYIQAKKIQIKKLLHYYMQILTMALVLYWIFFLLLPYFWNTFG